MTDQEGTPRRNRRLIVDNDAPNAAETPQPKPKRLDRLADQDDLVAAASPQDAPPVQDPATFDGLSNPQDAPPPPDAATSETLARTRRFRFSLWIRIFFGVLSALIAISVGLWADQLFRDALAASPIFGYIVLALLLLAVIAAFALVFRELAALGRIRRVGALRAKAAKALSDAGGARDAKAVASEIEALYRHRRDLAWSKAAFWSKLADHANDQVDPQARLALYEREVLGHLDTLACAEIERAARRVSTATALMPSALLDAAAALAINVMLIRRLAEIYGGRASLIGSLGLARQVVQHAMAAGLIEIGGDLLGPLLGGGIAGGASRRIGEGLVNGALTVRIGVAACEICRPMPFHALERPKIRELALGALRGVKFVRDKEQPAESDRRA